MTVEEDMKNGTNTPIVNAKTGKVMSRRGLRKWWKSPVTANDLTTKK